MLPKLIVLDPDAAVHRSIAEMVRSIYEPMCTADPKFAMGWVQNDRAVKVLLSEHVMGTAAGVSLLETVRSLRPDVRRVLMTRDYDLGAIVQGLHSGAIERLIHKPFPREELLGAVRLDAAAVHRLPAAAAGAPDRQRQMSA